MTIDTDPNSSNMTSAEHMTASFAVLELGVDASLEPTTAVTPTNQSNIDYCIKSEDDGDTITV